MMTEEQAVGRWCPFGRIGWMHETAENGVGGMTYNRDHEGNGDPHSLCLGSACMAWRWVSSLSVDRPDGINAIGGQRVSRTRGYCGLAGRP